MPDYNDPNKKAAPHEESKRVFENFRRAEDVLVGKKRDQWKEHYKLYRSVMEIADNDLASQLVIPLAFTTVEDILPRLVANRPRIEVHPREDADNTRAAKHRALLFYLWDMIPMVFKLVEFVKSAEIYGTAIFKVIYRQKEETRVNRVMADVNKYRLGLKVGTSREIQFKSEPTMVYNDVHVDLCEIDEVYPDPDGQDIDSCAWIIHRTVTNLHDLKAAKKDGKPLYKESVIAQLEKLVAAGNIVSEEGDKRLRDEIEEFFNQKSADKGDVLKRQMHILEQWEDTKVTVVVQEFPQVPPIRHEFNEVGQKPFVKFTPIPDPNKFYGIAIPELMHSMQLELSLLHSANLDNLLYSVHQMWKVLRTSGINSRNLRFRPGGVVPVKNMGDIEPLDRSYTDINLHRTSDDIRRWVQKVGVTDTFSGVASDLTGRTATEASLLAEASGSRAGLMFQVLTAQAMQPLGKLMVRLNELYLPDERSLRIIGDDFQDLQFEKISPEDLITGSGQDLDIVFDVAQTEPVTRQFKLMRAKDMLQSFGAIGLPPNHPVVEYILSELLRAYGKDRPEMLLKAPETRAIADQAAAAQGPAGDEVGSLAEQLAVD